MKIFGTLNSLVNRMFKICAILVTWTLCSSPLGAQVLPSKSPRPDAIRIDSCNVVYADALNGDYSVYVTARFRTIATMATTAVRFRFLMVDAFGKPIDAQSGTVTGIFAPNAEIEPRYAALTGTVLVASAQFPSSPAWHLYNALGKDLDHVTCVVDAVRFVDGTTQ